MKSSKFTDWILVVVINLMWATQVPAIRFIGDRLGPVTVAFVPMIISTALFLPFLLAENKRRGVAWRWKWNDMKYFVVSGLIGIFLMQYAYTLGSQLTLAANAGIITLTIPVIVAVFASFMLGERFNVVRLASFILAVAGVLMTSMADVTGPDFSENGFMTGNLIFFFACCCCGFYNTYCKVLVDKGYTELEILVYSSIIGCLVSIPLLIWVEPFNLKSFLANDTAVIWGVIELAIIVYGVSMLLFFYVLARMDVTQAILGNYLLPFFIALLGVVLLNERITPVMIMGGILILASTFMVTAYEGRILSWLSGGTNRKTTPSEKANTELKQ